MDRIRFGRLWITYLPTTNHNPFVSLHSLSLPQTRTWIFALWSFKLATIRSFVPITRLLFLNNLSLFNSPNLPKAELVVGNLGSRHSSDLTRRRRLEVSLGFFHCAAITLTSLAVDWTELRLPLLFREQPGRAEGLHAATHAVLLYLPHVLTHTPRLPTPGYRIVGQRWEVTSTMILLRA